MKDTILTYKRNGIEFPQYINPKFFSKLVREKVRNEHFEEYDAVLSIISQFISEVPESPDEYTFEYTDNDGFKHTFFGKLKK